MTHISAYRLPPTTRRASTAAKCVVVLVFGLTCLNGCRRSESPSVDRPSTENEQTPAEDRQPTDDGQQIVADGVLKDMAAAYKKASTYSDNGTVRLMAEGAMGRIDQSADFSLTFERPNKMHMDVYGATVVCDGKELYARVEDLPDQVLVRDAPKEFTMESIYRDRILATTLIQGFAGASPQWRLLTADDPMKILLHGVESASLGEPGKIGDRDYYCVNIVRKDGTAVFWVDRESHVLRRIELPTDELRRMLARGGEVKEVLLVADFVDARLDAKIDAGKFLVEVPSDANRVKFFVPPHPAQLLGKKAPEFRFTDLDGNSVTVESLAGKVAVLDFWAGWCSPCRKSLPMLSKIAEQFKDNQQIAFLAVSVDQPETKNQVLLDTLDELGVKLPIVRDTDRHTNTLFHATGIPTMFILDANGVVQDFHVGGDPDLADVLPEKLEKLLAGEDIYQEPLALYNKELEDYERALEASETKTSETETSKPDTPEGTVVEEHRIPQAKVAPRTEPETFKLSQLWTCSELKSPGNILVVTQPDGSVRLVVVVGWKSIAQLGLDGKLIAVHRLEIDKMEVVSNLRTVVDAEGKRYFAAVASAQQRFHLLDADFNVVFSFPADGLKHPHQGIADVELGDLAGDGKLQAYVGYWGVIGVQAVSLEGKRVWSNRSISNVVKMAVGGPDAQGQRLLFCTNNSGSLAKIDAEGDRRSEVTVDGRTLHWIVAADLTGDGQLEWCGMAAPKFGDNIAVGLNLKGEELWHYTLPGGIQPKPVEQIVFGRLAPVADDQWLLPGPDGSIHVIAADGKLLDRFNYGAVIGGLAVAEHDGRTLLIVSSPSGLEGWRVE